MTQPNTPHNKLLLIRLLLWFAYLLLGALFIYLIGDINSLILFIITLNIFAGSALGSLIGVITGRLFPKIRWNHIFLLAVGFVLSLQIVIFINGNPEDLLSASLLRTWLLFMLVYGLMGLSVGLMLKMAYSGLDWGKMLLGVSAWLIVPVLGIGPVLIVGNSFDGEAIEMVFFFLVVMSFPFGIFLMYRLFSKIILQKPVSEDISSSDLLQKD